MKTRLFAIMMLLMSSTLSYGCGIEGSGIIVSETRSTGNFNGIELKGIANVYISQSENTEVKVEAEDNIISHIKTDVKNGSLIISTDDNVNPKEPVNIYISAKDLCMIELSGSGNVVSNGTLNCNNLFVRLSGTGDIRLAMDAKSLKASLSGSGNLNLSGSTSESDIRLTGSGNINGRALKTFTSSVSISGSGTSTIDVHNDLTVNISGSGKVYYINAPGKIHSKITGTGEILQLS